MYQITEVMMAVIHIKNFVQNSNLAGSRQNGVKVREEILT